MKNLLREYRLEIILLVLALLVLFLIFEPFGIRGILMNSLQMSATAGLSASRSLMDRLVNILLSFSILDFAGLLIAICAVIFVIARVRYRYRANPEYDATVCPKCGGSIHRVHRSQFDRILGKTLFPTARRYRCSNEDCRWSGLRHARHKSERSVLEGSLPLMKSD